MKDKIQKVLSDSFGRDSGGVQVKQEDCYYTNRKGNYKRNNNSKKVNNFGRSKNKLGTNPVDSDGNIMRCHECDSTKHFASNCPHTGKVDSGTGSMLVESLGKGILDSACTKTVSGEEWLNEYIENLNEKDRKEVVCSETVGKSLFRFGDGVESKSINGKYSNSNR